MEADKIPSALTLEVSIKHSGTCFGEPGGRKQGAARSARGPGRKAVNNYSLPQLALSDADMKKKLLNIVGPREETLFPLGMEATG